MEKKDLLPMLPACIGIVILCAIARLYLYYAQFGVHIIAYIDTSEILLSFLDIPDTLFLLSITVLFFLSILKSLPFKWKEYILRKIKYDIDKKNYFVGTFILITGFLFYIFSIFNNQSDYDLATDYTEIQFGLFIISMCYSFVVISIIKLYNVVFDCDITSKRIINNVLYFSSALYLLCIFDAEMSANKIIKRNKLSSNVKFVYSNQKYQTDSNVVCVGFTKGYIFLYDKKINTTSVFPMIDISYLTLVKKIGK